MTANKTLKIICATILGIIFVIVSAGFVAGRYSIGSLEFPCTYQNAQGKKVYRKIENDLKGITIQGNGPTRESKDMSIDCLDGSLHNLMSLTYSYKLSSPMTLAEAEAAVLANDRLKKAATTQITPNLDSGFTVPGFKATYKGDTNQDYDVSYYFKQPVVCMKTDVPPEQRINHCKDTTLVQDFKLLEQPINEITISRPEVPKPR